MAAFFPQEWSAQWNSRIAQLQLDRALRHLEEDPEDVYAHMHAHHVTVERCRLISTSMGSATEQIP